ncbi:Crp/Fnr family transcriptional regulator [Actinomadura barringtoniae]|uniref:Crp/Fnr family transcriptional regulator n=1 Tax=Actinomadura barringtoniae TaxID=1427535 RepID=A0A939TBX2_9ACTN|nr:Crp/Fnr family transcriptional regulator [Actinomadura barringtoniae]MBO2453967.1 Crp/Fnr family transcriptional regulator [Actinomadura barringtoniae]
MATPQPGLPGGKPFWERLSPQDRDALSEISSEESFAPGACVCNEGENAWFALVIIDGWVKVSNISVDGQPVLQALRTRGDLVGESAMAEGCERISTVTAATKVRALSVPSEAFRQFLHESEDADIALRLTYRDKQIESDWRCLRLGGASVKQRLAQLMVSTADRSRVEPVDGVLKLEPPLTQDDLAQLVRAARSGVESALREWRARSIVQTSRRSVTLIDIPYLRRLAAH